MEKIIIVEHYLGSEYNITTVDTTDRNRIKKFVVDDYSNVEFANRIIKRVEEDGFNKVFIDANGINVALIDILVDKFKELGYTYDPKTGSVNKPVTVKLNANDWNWGSLISSIEIPKEEF